MNLIRKNTYHARPMQKDLCRIIGVGTAVPAFSSTQKDILDFVLSHLPVQERTKELYQKTFSNPSIQKRHFAVRSLTDVLDMNHNRISKRFQEAASDLSHRALQSALAESGISAAAIDFVITATCTGYLCPGLTSYLIERAALRPDVHTADLTGMGCGAALPALEQATHFVRSHPGSTAAVVCTEICSAALFSNDEPGIVISNTLFADGAACVLIQSGRENTFNNDGVRHPVLQTFSSVTIPEWRDSLRFQTESGYLKNVLGKEVPRQSAEAVNRVVSDLLEKTEMKKNDITHWLLHPGGEKIINSIQKKIGMDPIHLQASRTVLKNFGNMSSPSALFVLAEDHRTTNPKPGEFGILSSFGAGFSAYAALLEY